MYQPMAHAKRNVEKANLNGLIQALTLKIWVVVSWVSSKHTNENTKHTKPNQKRASLRSRNSWMKSIMGAKKSKIGGLPLACP